MPALKEIALKVAVLATLADKVRAALADARTEQAEAMKDVGADGVKVELDDGTKVASISLASGRVTARVADEDDFMGWVTENHPDEIETVTRVKPGFADRLLTQAAGAGAPIDVTTGELIPGVGISVGAQYVSTRGLRRDVIEQAWRDGRINPLDYVELPQIEAP
jgi:hypothetical protein